MIGKAALGRAVFSLAGIHRIHIIGCARSGTTMLHLAMSCFDRVTLCPTESKPRYPHLSERIALALRLGVHRGPKHYVTKRGFEWHKPSCVDELLKCTRLENIGIIHLVRDPRDVMVSRASSMPDRAYVWHERWYDSIMAADRIFESIADYPRKLILRYEDIVLDPAATQEKIAAVFGLRLNSGALPINRVQENFERLGIHFDRQLLMALNGLRNMDTQSIGNWRERGAPDFNSMRPEILARYRTFCRQYGYEEP